MKKIIFVFIILLYTTQALAQWDITLDASTDIPIQSGAHATLELPGRVRLSTTLGWLPGAYVKLINAVVVAAGGYDQSTADLVEHSLQNSLVLRLHAGWRPFESLGLYFEVGYGLATLGGGINSEDILTLATGFSPPSTEPTRMRTYDITSTLHMIDAEIGWGFSIWKGLTLRVALGFAGTLAASTSVKPAFPVVLPGVVEAFTKPTEDYLNDTYTSYVFAPTISAALGWSFQVFTGD